MTRLLAAAAFVLSLSTASAQVVVDDLESLNGEAEAPCPTSSSQ
jgi:hypothetical protein